MPAGARAATSWRAAAPTGCLPDEPEEGRGRFGLHPVPGRRDQPLVVIINDRKGDQKMANYVFAYSGGKGVSADETERNEQYAQWGRWFEELGSAIVDGGAAMGTAKTVAPGGSVSDGGSRALTGYSI